MLLTRFCADPGPLALPRTQYRSGSKEKSLGREREHVSSAPCRRHHREGGRAWKEERRKSLRRDRKADYEIAATRFHRPEVRIERPISRPSNLWPRSQK